MKRAMATEICTEPSTGHTIHATQVLDLSDADFDELAAAGKVVASKAEPTQDVGALAMQSAKGDK